MPNGYEPAEHQKVTEYQEAILEPEVLEMIADGLDDRATTLQAEAERAADDGETLREMAEKLRD